MKKKKNEINKIKKEIAKIISPEYKSKNKKSSFCEALEKGEWVLFEQIEHCFQNKEKLNDFISDLIISFKLTKEVNIIFGENEIEATKEIIKLINDIKNYLENTNTQLNYSFKPLIKKFEILNLNDIEKIISILYKKLLS